MSGLRQHVHEIHVRTSGQGLYEFTSEVVSWVRACGVKTGLLTLHVRHTSASLLIQENADPDVQRDLDAFLKRIVPEDPSLYRHDDEGPDDMPAHLRASMTKTSEVVPVTKGRLALGTWQAIYLWEHRRTPHTRTLVVHVQGV